MVEVQHTCLDCLQTKKIIWIDVFGILNVGNLTIIG